MPRVTVFMSSYNYARYLRQSIESVLNQTCSDFELFIVDDASTDESWLIIQSYQDPRIRAIRNPINRNDKVIMREVILGQASGEYIAVHHSDNLWLPNKLEEQIRYLDENSKLGAVFTQVQLIDEAGNDFADPSHPYFGIFEQPNRSRQEWLNRFFFTGNALCHPSVLIRKKVYEECGFYRNGLMQLPDFDMWVRVCMAYEIHILPEKLVKFRIESNGNNISGDRVDSRNRLRFEYMQVLNNYKTISDFEEFIKIFPQAEKYYNAEGCDLPFLLGKITLDTEPLNPDRALFGLQLLFDAISDASRSTLIERLYGFTHKDFAQLSGGFDLFAVEHMSQLRRQYTAVEAEDHELTVRLEKLASSSPISKPSFFHRLVNKIRAFSNY